MVQIMSDSGESSRNRAERASLDGKPEYPNDTALETTTNLIKPLVESDVINNNATTSNAISRSHLSKDDDEYEEYGLSEKLSSRKISDNSSSNDATDIEKDCGLVTDPWAATASFVDPNMETTSQNNPTTSSSAPFTLSNRQHLHPPTTTHMTNKRQRRSSKGSSKSSSGTSSTGRFSSASTERVASVKSRRRSSSNVDENEANHDERHSEDNSSASCSTSTNTCCYICFLRFPNYSTWKRHAVYEHILKNNPFPMVEMNYIDPSIFNVTTPDDEVVDENVVHQSEEENVPEIMPNVDNNLAEEIHGNLKLCIGKEKGGYVVKKSSTGSSGDDYSNPPTLYPSIAGVSTPSHKINITNIPSQTSPELTANLDEQSNRMISIESELEHDLIGVDFEMALELAAERSRIGMLPTSSENGTMIATSSSSETQASLPLISGKSAAVTAVVGELAKETSGIINSPLLHKTLSENPNSEANENDKNNNTELDQSSADNESGDLVINEQNEDSENNVENVSNIDTEKSEQENSLKNKNENKNGSLPIGEKEAGPSTVESVEDFECQVCHKVFVNEDELDDHFKQEHFRLAGGQGILEPPTPQTPSIFGNENDEEEVEISINPALLLSHDPLIVVPRTVETPSYETVANSNSNPTGQIIRRPSSETIPRAPSMTTSAQDHLQQLYRSQQLVQLNRQNPMLSRYPTQTQPQRPMMQRISPPNMMATGISNSNRGPGLPNQVLSRQPGFPNQIRQIHNHPSHPFMNGQQQQQQPQRLPMNRITTPSYPMSLHNALTGPPSYAQSNMIQQQRHPGAMPNRQPQMINRQINPHPLPQQQQFHQRPNMPLSNGRPQGPHQMSQTIGMQQQLINQMNAQRELNNQFQQRHQLQGHPHPQQQMPRLQQIPQQRMPQGNRPGPQSQKRPATQVGSIEISEIRSNKEPRIEAQRNLPPAEIRPLNPPSNSSQLNQNVAAAIGSVGIGTVNSVRLGNSITLSVCPTDSSASNSPTTSPVPQQSTIITRRSSASSTPSSPAPNSPVQSVLTASRFGGATLTTTSPPITSISPPSNPSPSNSPGVHLQNSVIQRGPRTTNPVLGESERNFSPPIIHSVRGNVTQQIQQPPQQFHNFAVPRPPPPSIHRIQLTQQQQQQLPNNSNVTVNLVANRPERPPTVDLTEDDIQAHASQQQRFYSLSSQNPNQPVRRMNPPSAIRGQRPNVCNICGLAFSSIQAVDIHKLSTHGAVMRMNQNSAPNNNTGNGMPNPRLSQQQQQPGQLRNPMPPPPLCARPNNNSNAANNIVQAPTRTVAGPGPIFRQANGQTRPQSPNTQNASNNQAKYLYIPLLDMSRMDSNKMRKLEEIGISCVVPLQGANGLSAMAMPVMNLRNEALGGGTMVNHLPWDSVLPIGPAQPNLDATSRVNNPQNNTSPIGSRPQN